MIVVSGTFQFDPSKQDETIAATAELSAASMAEDGCHEYAFWPSSSEPGVFRVFEEWESDEAMAAHFSTPHIAAFMGAVGDLGLSSMDVQRYDVSAKSKLM